MENCLVTKLKESIQNETLPKINELVVKIVNDNIDTEAIQYTNRLVINNGNGYNPITYSVNLTENHSIYEYDPNTGKVGNVIGNSTTGTSLDLCFPEIGTYYLKFSPKEEFYIFQLPQTSIVSASSLNYIKLIQLILKEIPGITGTLDEALNYNKDRVQYIRLEGCSNVNLSAETLSTCENLLNIEIVRTPNFKGNFELLGNLTGVTNWRIQQSGLSGSVEGFVRNQLLKGISSKSITMNWLESNSGLRFKNESIPIGTNSFSWEPYGNNQTKIALNGGSETIIDNPM